MVADFEDMVVPLIQSSLQVGGGSFFAIATANNNVGSWSVIAKFAGDEIYLPTERSANYSTIMPTWGLGGGRKWICSEPRYLEWFRSR